MSVHGANTSFGKQTDHCSKNGSPSNQPWDPALDFSSLGWFHLVKWD